MTPSPAGLLEAMRHRHPARAARIAAGVGVLVATLASGAPARAAVMDLIDATFEFQIGGLAPITVAQSPGTIPVLVSSGTGGFLFPAGVFATSTLLPFELFTGVPLISSLGLTASNRTGAFTAADGPGGGFGGAMPLQGFNVVGVLGGLINVEVPLTVVGQGGTTTVILPSIRIMLTGAQWTTGPAVVTGVTPTPPFGVGANTVTLSGYDARTAGHAGILQLVTPIRIMTNVVGNIPAFATTKLFFFPVPEPGTLVLIGAAGIAVWKARRASSASRRSG